MPRFLLVYIAVLLLIVGCFCVLQRREYARDHFFAMTHKLAPEMDPDESRSLVRTPFQLSPRPERSRR